MIEDRSFLWSNWMGAALSILPLCLPLFIPFLFSLSPLSLPLSLSLLFSGCLLPFFSPAPLFFCFPHIFSYPFPPSVLTPPLLSPSSPYKKLPGQRWSWLSNNKMLNHQFWRRTMVSSICTNWVGWNFDGKTVYGQQSSIHVSHILCLVIRLVGQSSIV